MPRCHEPHCSNEAALVVESLTKHCYPVYYCESCFQVGEQAMHRNAPTCAHCKKDDHPEETV